MSQIHPNLTRAGKGRPRGSKNKVSREMCEFAREVLSNPCYREALKERIIAGRAPEIEKLLYYYAYGKPPTSLELEARIEPASGVRIYLPEKDKLEEGEPGDSPLADASEAQRAA